MKWLIVVAHGSRRESSNDEVRALTARIGELSLEQFDRVTCAFLELAEPSIPDAVESALLQGAMEVVVMPYFLSAGRHVVTDIPEEVAKTTRRYPGANVRIANYLGSSDLLPSILLGLAGR